MQRGRPIVYTTSAAVLAAIEELVPVDPLAAAADPRLLSIDALETSFLPIALLRSAGNAALRVPSAVIRTERNIQISMDETAAVVTAPPPAAPG